MPNNIGYSYEMHEREIARAERWKTPINSIKWNSLYNKTIRYDGISRSAGLQRFRGSDFIYIGLFQQRPWFSQIGQITELLYYRLAQFMQFNARLSGLWLSPLVPQFDLTWFERKGGARAPLSGFNGWRCAIIKRNISPFQRHAVASAAARRWRSVWSNKPGRTSTIWSIITAEVYKASSSPLPTLSAFWRVRWLTEYFERINVNKNL